VREQARDEVRVARRDHRVAVAVGHEHRLFDGRQPLQLRVIRDPPRWSLGADDRGERTRSRNLGEAQRPVCCLGPRPCVLSGR
jgi:hypothetical protein